MFGCFNFYIFMYTFYTLFSDNRDDDDDRIVDKLKEKRLLDSSAEIDTGDTQRLFFFFTKTTTTTTEDNQIDCLEVT